MKNINLIESFLQNTFGHPSKKGVKAAKIAFSELVAQFESWLSPNFSVEGKSSKDENDNIYFHFTSCQFQFEFSLTESKILQLAISPQSQAYAGFDKPFKFVTNDLKSGWDAIYAKLKEAIHNEWQSVANNLSVIDCGHSYLRAYSGYKAMVAYSGGETSFTLNDSKGESIGSLNPYEAARIRDDVQKTDKKGRNFVIYNCSSELKFWELKPHYVLLQSVEEFERDGKQCFKVNVSGSNYVFSVSEYYPDDCFGKRIGTLSVHDFYEQGDSSEWKGQWEKWVIESHLNKVSKHPEKIVEF